MQLGVSQNNIREFCLEYKHWTRISSDNVWTDHQLFPCPRNIYSKLLLLRFTPVNLCNRIPDLNIPSNIRLIYMDFVFPRNRDDKEHLVHKSLNRQSILTINMSKITRIEWLIVKSMKSYILNNWQRVDNRKDSFVDSTLQQYCLLVIKT